MKNSPPDKILLYQSVGFLMIIALSWIDECLDLHRLILGHNPYISDFRESTLEMLLILVVWLLVARVTRRFIARLRILESFMKVCAWCRRIENHRHWMRMEEDFEKNF